MEAKFETKSSFNVKVGDEVRQRYWSERFYPVIKVSKDCITIEADGRPLTYQRSAFSEWLVTVQPKPAKKKTSTATQAYKGNGKHDWEAVTSNPSTANATMRLRVPGGWLYRLHTAITFVPMPEVVKHAI